MVRSILLASVCGVALASAPALAQAADSAPPVPAAQQSGPDAAASGPAEIIVTGSRVIRDGSKEPTPVTVVAAADLAKARPGLVAEALNQLPSFRGSSGASTGFTSAVGPLTGSYLNLRNLGVQRTLVLVDGRRASPTSRDGSTDVNLLPQDLIKRVDIVTGGASAAYGSDAVAGVVNFVLDTDFTGLKATAQGGISGQGDAQTYKASLTGGTKFADGRGRIVASASYFSVGGLQSAADRSWSADNVGFLSNPAVPGQLIFASNVRASTASAGGLVLSGPFAGQQFAPDGSLVPFSRGSIQSGVVQVGGDGAKALSNLSAAVRTQNYFGHAEYDVTDKLTLFAQGNLSFARNHYNQIQQFNIVGFNGFTIFSGNPYLNPAAQAALTATGTPAFAMGRINFDFGSPANATAKARTIDATAGFRYDGPGTLKIDGYYEHGENRTVVETHNNVALGRLYAAADAVRDPASGNIVCRVTLTNPGAHPGCVPINLFGSGAPSQAAINYVEGTSHYVTKLTQDVADLSLRAQPFSTWAGPVSLAAGGQYRREQLNQATDSIGPSINNADLSVRGFPAAYQNQPGGWLLTNVFPIQGKYNLWEVFGEAAVPLARELPFLYALDVNGAIRYTHYSTSGGVVTWKGGAVWQPVEGIRLRGTASRDIRAPNVPELFSGVVQATGSVIDRGATTPIIVASQGNPALKPEKAKTLTGGVVFTPSFAPGLSLSVDYYSIDIKGVISSLSAQQTLDQCNAGATALCSSITRNAAGVITRIQSPTLNLNRQKTAGLDIELDYRPRGQVAGGNTAIRVLTSYLAKQELTLSGAAPVDYAGGVGLSAAAYMNNPRWTVTANVEWSKGPFELFAQERFISPGTYDVTRIQPTTIADNHVKSVFYTDLTAAWNVNKGFRFFVTVNNLFDRDPPLAPTGTLFTFVATNQQLYDVIGRRFTAGVNLKF